jgi:nicotinate-nucleotide adenylyltransferase
MERLGLLGGTFDPPHNAHLALARESLRQMGLSRVLWLLTPDPPHKDRPDITPYPLRREMLLAIIAGNPSFELCEVESERPGPHFLVDTIRILLPRYPDAEISVLLGEDSLRDLPAWHRPQDVFLLCPLIVMRRSKCKADMEILERSLPGITARTRFLDAPPMDISSTEIRRRIKAGRKIAGLLPAPVEKIIRQNSLYR